MNDIDRLRDLALSETGFLFDPYSGATFSLNPTAVTILRALRGSADRVAAELRSFCEASRVDEIMVLSMIHDHDARCRSLSLVRDVLATLP